ncbi:MAG: DUF1800 domain-containing protein [Candidatus Caenarcaniphilales bacterium]|nr:DUF1800 domain-containing protein [Candidatus Caenarcaniphilales bacterium]
MSKILWLMFLVVCLCFTSLAAKANKFPAPINSISIKSANENYPRQAKVGESFNLQISFDKDFQIDSLSIFEHSPSLEAVCSETECNLNLDITVDASMLQAEKKLIVKYKKNNFTRSLVFERVPFRLLTASASFNQIAGIRLRSSNPSFQNFAFVGDQILLSFFSKQDFSFENISSLKFAGQDLDIASLEKESLDLDAIKKLNVIKVPVNEETPLGKVSFELKLAELVFNEAVNDVYPVVIPNSIVNNVFELSTTNIINPRIVSYNDSLYLKFSSSFDLQITKSEINSKEYSPEFTKNCKALVCENILTYKLDPELFSKPLDIKIEYFENGLQKTYETNNSIVSMGDYVKHHVLNRVSFGKDSESLEKIERSGWRSYVIEQLNPVSIDDSAFEAMNSFENLDTNPDNNLALYSFDKMLYSKKQLLEKMTWFWENHFSTSLRKWAHVDWRYFNRKERYAADFERRFRSGNYRDLGFNEIKPFISNDFIHHLNINTADYDTLELKVRYNQSDDEPLTKIYWKNQENEEEFSEAKSVTYQPVYDRSTQVYSVDLSANSEWQGTLTGLGIEPFVREQDSGIRSRALIYYIKLKDSNAVNTDKLILYTSSYAERWTNDFFRANAFGNFTDLLKDNAKSPSMLYYLDNYLNNKAYAQENYAREVMELHALGVDGGYTEEDVRSVAEMFTGLTFVADKVFYDSDEHLFKDLEVSFLDEVIPGGTSQADFINQVDTFLEKLAAHPSTAKFICKKLIEYFVDENVPSALQLSCQNTFLANAEDANQLKKVMEVILLDDEFVDYSHYRNKIANPMFQAIQVMRAGWDDNLDQRYNGSTKNTVYNQAASQEFVPGFAGPPTGYKEISTSWMNQGQLVKRIAYNKKVSKDFAYREAHLTAIINKFQDKTKEDFLRYVLDIFVADAYTDEEFNALLALFPEDFAFNVAYNNVQTMKRIFFIAASMPRSQLF